MRKALYIFNPWHDLALANNDPNFNAPSSAMQFEYDCCEIPVWYSNHESIVYCNKDLAQWFSEIKIDFPQLSSIQIVENIDNQLFNKIHPWGWDNVIKTKLSNSGFNSDILPPQEHLLKIRKLSNRKLAVEALQALIENSTIKCNLPTSSDILTKPEDVVDFAIKHGAVLYKAPWSGSGKGLRWVRAGLSDSHYGWCKNILLTQGSLIAEKIYDKIQDFAMEFECKNGKTEFAGYSLFSTENGIYRSNYLASDKKIEEILIAKGLDKENIKKINNHFIDYFNKMIAPDYTGSLGVDMFIYLENGSVKFHPCVEINLRMTMGYLARIFYDRFVSEDKEGIFYIDHIPTKGDLLKDHLNRKDEFPLKIKSGRIISGYLALNCIDSETCYRVRVEVG